MSSPTRPKGMMIKRVLVGLVVLAAMAGAPPAAAAGDSYVSPARAWVEPAVIAPGGSSTITFSEGFFDSEQLIGVSIGGVRAADARVLPAGGAGAGPLVSDSNGGMTAVFVAPARGSGRYSVTFSASRDHVVVITVVPRAAHSGAPSATPPPDARASPPLPPLAAPADPSVPEEMTPTPPDREGNVRIPSDRPDAPAWPELAELPWAIILLAAITLIAGTVTATLLIAARRRG